MNSVVLPAWAFVLVVGLVALRAVAEEPAACPKEAVRFQAHRGGLREVPENTLAACRYAWGLGGIPEVDICTTSDGKIICLHDSTLARTTDAPDRLRNTPVKELTFDETRKWDCGRWFDPRFEGERVPSLREVFTEMHGHPERQVYLDLKKIDLGQLAGLITEYDVAEQVIFCHCVQQNCITLRELTPKVRTMLWIGDKPDEIMRKFEAAFATGFKGLDQVQLHLNAAAPATDSEGFLGYALDEPFIADALERTAAAGIDLEVLPFEFTETTIAGLLDLGVRWYATDEPKRFTACVNQWTTRADGPARP